MAVAGLVLGCGGSAPAQVAGRRAVRVEKVRARVLDDGFRYAGTLEPVSQVELAFKVGGRVASLLAVRDGQATRPVQEGDRVRRGQVLAQLDPRDLVLSLGAADAGTAGAKAQLEGAEGAAAQAGLEVGRARTLFAKEALPKADLDRAEAANVAAGAQVAALRSQHEARGEQSALAANGVRETRLVCPLDGVVARRATDPGETVNPGVPVFTVIDTSHLRLVTGVPDVLVNALTPGQRVPLSGDAFAERTFLGTIAKVAPVADPMLRTFAVEVDVPNLDGALKPGMTATAVFERTAPGPAHLVVPLRAVVRGTRGDGFAVFLAGADGTATRRDVTLGDLYEDGVVVESGLAQDEAVVVEGAAFLRDGAAVVVLP